VTKSELEEVGLGHLVGTPLLRAYMHGFFVDAKLHRLLFFSFAVLVWGRKGAREGKGGKFELSACEEIRNCGGVLVSKRGREKRVMD